MKSFNTQYKDRDSLKKFIAQNGIHKSENTLVQIFSGSANKSKIIALSSMIKKILPDASVMGSTTCGEILAGKIYDKSTVISFSVFNKTVVKSNLYTTLNAKKVLKDLTQENTKVLIVFSDGLKSKAEQFVKELHALEPDILIVGGRAGDNYKFKKTYIFNESVYTDSGCVIASLSSDSLYSNNDYILDWTPIGTDMVVTKVKDNVLYELDGVPIFDVYKKYLGNDVMDDFPHASLEFPLIVKKGDIFIARDPILKTEDNALMFAGNFEKGDRVRFSFGNIDDIASLSGEYFDRLKKFPAESIFVYSCAARKALMQEKLEDEMNVLESIATTVGFFTYGEYFHAANVMELLNVTTTFVMLSESSNVPKRVLKRVKAKETDAVKRVLTHLIKVTTKELEHISTHDTLTSLYNRAAYIKRVGLKIKSATRYNEYFGLILVDIDHFKLINDNYGHIAGDKVLQQFAKIFTESVREDDFIVRWGGEEFIIIVNYATIEDLEKLVKKLQKKIEKVSFSPVPRVTVSFGLTVFSIGDSDETLFKRADNALYTAKQNGRNTYVIG